MYAACGCGSILIHRFTTTLQKGSEAGSYLRLIDSCITLLKAQGPSRACNESKEEEEEDAGRCSWEESRGQRSHDKRALPRGHARSHSGARIDAGHVQLMGCNVSSSLDVQKVGVPVRNGET